MRVYRPADALLKELGVTEPRDIDVEAIAYHCGVVVRYRHLDGCAARIIGRGNRAICSVDPNCSRRRRRFSVGHELGHWMHDRGKAGYLCQKRDLRTPWGVFESPEARANRYAADLLMPAKMFKPAASKRPMTLDTANELSDLFRTSLTATAIRLVELGSYPAMVVCHGQEGRRWYAPGPDIPRFLRPLEELSPDTEAFDLLFGHATHSRPLDVGAEAWIDHRASERYRVREHSLRIAEDTVLSMLWWKDEAQIVDLT